MAYPTNPIYKLVKDGLSGQVSCVLKSGTTVLCIPFDEDNTDYQEYLKWCNGEYPYTEKGIPEEAD